MQKGDGELIAATVAVEALLQAIEEGVWEGIEPIGGLRVHAECLRRSLWRLGEAIRTQNGEYEKWTRAEFFDATPRPVFRFDEHGD